MSTGHWCTVKPLCCKQHNLYSRGTIWWTETYWRNTHHHFNNSPTYEKLTFCTSSCLWSLTFGDWLTAAYIHMLLTLDQSHLVRFPPPDPAWGSPPCPSAGGHPETSCFSRRTQSPLGLLHPLLLLLMTHTWWTDANRKGVNRDWDEAGHNARWLWHNLYDKSTKRWRSDCLS